MSDEPLCQVFHPVHERWLLVSTRTGHVIETKETPGPYEHILVGDFYEHRERHGGSDGLRHEG